MPIERFEVVTRVPDVAHQVLNDVYNADRAMQFTATRTDFEFGLRSSSAGVVSTDNLRHSMATRAVTAPFPSLITARVLRGQLRFTSGGEDVQLLPGDLVRYPTEDGLECEWADLEMELIRLPLETIDTVAAQEADNARPVRFHSMRAASPADVQRWIALSRFVHELLTGSDSPAEAPIVAHRLAELVAATALQVFPNSIMTMDQAAAARDIGPAWTHRAAEFMESRAIDPITVTDVARAVGVTPRALQLAFRRYYDTTPREYLRRVRLEAAHRDLQVADPTTGATVKAIATRWGFAQPDRFAALYRTRFGVPPSRTLRD
jgi:AraC-like DNA-binding protein